MGRGKRRCCTFNEKFISNQITFFKVLFKYIQETEGFFRKFDFNNGFNN